MQFPESLEDSPFNMQSFLYWVDFTILHTMILGNGVVCFPSFIEKGSIFHKDRVTDRRPKGSTIQV